MNKVSDLKKLSREEMINFFIDSGIETNEQLAELLNVSRQRVHQVLVSKGLEKPFLHIKNYKKYKNSLSNNVSYETYDIWKPLPFNKELRKYYEVSDKGGVRQVIHYSYGVFTHTYCKRKHTFVTAYSKKKPEGYIGTDLVYKDGSRVRNSVHRLVAQAFIPNPYKLPCVNHIDGDSHNNYVDNLEWCTYSDNSLHYWDFIHENSDNKRYSYELTSPNKQKIVVHNLRKWCRENNMQEVYPNFVQCLKRKDGTCLDGWKIDYLPK